MKKKVLALLMAVICLSMGSFATDINVQAEEMGQDIDIAYLLGDENTLIGYANLQTWGVYLKEGSSLLNDLEDGTLACGGITTANVKCTVSVTVILEREVDGSWENVTSWTVTNQNAKMAAASKSMAVGSGYWYRCRCTHSAGTDTASSSTDALWM